MLENVQKKRKESHRMKTVKNYQCDWCRRLLQNPSGLIRHKSYCVWNPDFKSIREKEKSELGKSEQMQCEWCNRFFNSHHGVERHKTYCAWHPERLKALKEQRKRKRNEKAITKQKREYTERLDKLNEKAIDEGCPNSPTSSESDDNFHVSNFAIKMEEIEPEQKMARTTVIRSNSRNCNCGCQYVDLTTDFEEEIDVENF